MSPLAQKEHKPAHLFWSWSGIVLVVPAPLILLFVAWIYAPISFVLGIVIMVAARKSAADFLVQNMLWDDTFYTYVIHHGGAQVFDQKT